MNPKRLIEMCLDTEYVFVKRLPTHLYNPNPHTYSYVVSPYNQKAIQSIRNLLGEEMIAKSDSDCLKIQIGNYTTYKILTVKQNADFCWMNRYAFLGGILGGILKRVNKNLVLNDEGLFLKRYHYVKENDNHLIHEKLVTNNFNLILNVFKLKISDFINGFDTKEEYFDYLLRSPYIHMRSIKCYKDSKTSFLKEFYDYAVTQQETSELVLISLDKFWKHMSSFDLKQFDIEYERRLQLKLDYENKLEFNSVFESLKDIVSDKSKVGIILANFKNSFASRGVFQTFINNTNKESVLNQIKKFAIISKN